MRDKILTISITVLIRRTEPMASHVSTLAPKVRRRLFLQRIYGHLLFLDAISNLQHEMNVAK